MNKEVYSPNFEVILHVAIYKSVTKNADFSTILQNFFPKINDLQTL